LRILKKEYERLSTDGFRVLAIATKDVAARGKAADGATPYGKADECDLILNGYVAFLDRPRKRGHGRNQGFARARRAGQGFDRRITTWWPVRYAKEVGLSNGISLCWAMNSKKMTDVQLADAGRKDHPLRPRLARA